MPRKRTTRRVPYSFVPTGWHFRSTGPYNRYTDVPHDRARAVVWRGARAGGRRRRICLPFRGSPTTLPAPSSSSSASMGWIRRSLERWMKAGELPNLSRLASTGGVRPLTTTHSPESPDGVGVVRDRRQPGQAQHLRLPGARHGDLPARPRAWCGASRRSSSSTTIPIAKPKLLSIRGGTSFWVTAGQAGVRSSILTVPVTFPPEDVPNGELLSGLPLPDIRGTMGTFYYFATDLSRYEEGNTEFGGILKRLASMEQDVARTELDRSAQPDRAIRDSGPAQQRPDAERRRSRDDRRAPGAGRRARADDDQVEAGGEDGHRRDPGPVAAARAGQDGAGGSTSSSA